MNERQAHAEPLATDACGTCRGAGRLWVQTRPKGIPTWQPVPCPSCRPEASPLNAEGQLKDLDGLAAARAAVRGGA